MSISKRRCRVIIALIQRQLLPHAVFAFAPCGDPPPHCGDMLTEGEVDTVLVDRGISSSTPGNPPILLPLSPLSPSPLLEGCVYFATTPSTLVFYFSIEPCLVSRFFLQKPVSGGHEPEASRRIWPGDGVDTLGFRGTSNTHRNRH